MFIHQLAGGAFDSAASTVDSTVPAGAMSADALRHMWDGLTQQVGQLQTLSDPRVTPHDSLRIVDFAARFARQPLSIRIVLTPALRIAGLWFDRARLPEYHAADYIDTTKFTERDVTVGHGPLPLPGTLSVPALAGRHAAVVLVHGSGPGDRDESIGGARPFRDIAWGLATRGIVVLRYDKRTRVHAGSMDPHSITVESEILDDVDDALALLRSQPEVDSTRVYVLGHSEGATLTPEIAARDGHLAGAVMLAASARPLAEVTAAQIRYLSASAPNQTDAERAQASAFLETLHELSAHQLPPDSIVLGAPVRYWDELDALHPLERARQIKTPLLILQGGRDYQVTTGDLKLWREALRTRKNVIIKEYPTLNHLFIAGSAPSTPAEYEREGHVDRQVILDIASFCGSPPGGVGRRRLTPRHPA
jgi:uncharacterized protein